MTAEPMIILDTETTDYRPGQIAQLSYILADGDAITGAGNYWFAVEYMSPGAEQVHGLSEELLWRLSGGLTFEDQVSRFHGDFEGRMVVAHNTPFDMGFLAAEFSRASLFEPRSTFCTMRMSTSPAVCRGPPAGTNGPSSKRRCAVSTSPRKRCPRWPIRSSRGEGAGFHDARYDTARCI